MNIQYNPRTRQFRCPRAGPLSKDRALEMAVTITHAETGRDLTNEFRLMLGSGPETPLNPVKLRACRRCAAPTHNYFYCDEMCRRSAYSDNTELGTCARE